MTKTREKLLNRAKKENLSQEKIDFLTKEDYFPEYFYECIFHFLVSKSDEEFESYGYKLLEDLFFISGNRKIFRKYMNIFYHNYPCEKVIELLPYIKEDYLLPIDMCCFAYKACNWDLEDTLYIFELAKKEENVRLYLNYINIFDKKGNPYLISTTIYLWLITLTASKELSILLLKLYNDGAIGMSSSFLGLRVRSID